MIRWTPGADKVLPVWAAPRRSSGQMEGLEKHHDEGHQRGRKSRFCRLWDHLDVLMVARSVVRI